MCGSMSSFAAMWVATERRRSWTTQGVIGARPRAARAAFDRKVIAQIDFSEIKHRPQPIAVATNGLASISDSVPEFVVTKEASLHMDDAPQNLGSVPVTKTMWQTDMIAIRLKFRLSWILRDPRAVAWVQGCTW